MEDHRGGGQKEERMAGDEQEDSLSVSFFLSVSRRGSRVSTAGCRLSFVFAACALLSFVFAVCACACAHVLLSHALHAPALDMFGCPR